MKIFDIEGQFVKTINKASDSLSQFHFPTFASTTDDDELLINDALNYQIKRFEQAIDGSL